MMDEIEQIWDDVLSEQEARVLRSWRLLDAEEQRAMREHLERMADPAEGYTTGQQESATFALGVIARA